MMRDDDDDINDDDDHECAADVFWPKLAIFLLLLSCGNPRVYP